MLQVATKKQWKDVCRVHALTVGLREIGWPVVVHDARNTAGLFGIWPAAFKLRNSTGESKEQRQMPSGGTARGSDPVRVDAETRCVSSQPAHSSLHIVDWS